MADFALHVFEHHFGPEFGHGKAFDLARLRRVLGALGDPQAKLPPVIHVAGTNGKGSTIAFMRAIAEAAGLRVHAFTQPHLFAMNERFVVAGEIVGDAALIDAAERIARVDTAITQFDAQTAAAFLLFSETPADVVLLETGMGGRDDSTNVIERPALSVITPVGLDHMDVLGGSVERIAAHKAGIIKAGVPIVSGLQLADADDVIEAQAARLGAPYVRIRVDDYYHPGRIVVEGGGRTLNLPLPTLQGVFQIFNEALAAVAMTTWRDFSDEIIAQGLRDARWPGRMQQLTDGRLSAPIRALGGEVWVDGAHNLDGARAAHYALQLMREEHGGGANIAIVGLRARKNAQHFVEALAQGFIDRIIAVPLADAHIAESEIVKLADALRLPAEAAPSLEAAMQSAAQFPAPRVLICGSLSLVAEALSAESA